MPGLTDSQLEFYRECGYLLIENALPASALEPLIREFEQAVDQNADAARAAGLVTDTYPGEPFPTRLARIIESAPRRDQVDGLESVLYRGISAKVKSPEMFKLLCHPVLLDIVESVIGPEILAHPQFNVRAKLPKQDRSVVPWHQDLGYLQADAADTFMVNFWIPLVDTDENNGCMEVIPGSHRTFVEHVPGLGPAANFKGIPDAAVPGGKRVVCALPKGGLLLTQHRILHRSGPNLSDHIRWSLDLRYCDPEQPSGRDGVAGFVARSRAHRNRWRVGWRIGCN